MITKEMAIKLGERQCDEIHLNGCTCTMGPRGGIKVNIERWRPSGRCKTWKRNPERFKLPIKHGLYTNYYITEKNCDLYHLAEDCPALKEKLTMEYKNRGLTPRNVPINKLGDV
jgi:hypothetical protein